MKVYRSSRQLLADVERLLAANRPDVHHSPLEDVIDLLCRGRHYAWLGIFLAVANGSGSPGEVTLPETRSKILVSMKLGSRELGILRAEGDHISVQDRILLESVANVLARFLAGRGQYLVRRARTRRTGNREPGNDN